MNILFINPKTEGYSRSVTLPLGLLSIASYLENEGYKVRIYDRTVDKTKKELVINSFKPDIIGISLISTKSIKDALEISVFSKDFGLPVIWGGPLASELPESVLVHDEVDIVSIGEGEETWLELARYFEKKVGNISDIKGIAYKANGVFAKTENRDFINLENLPPINWNLADVPKYFQSSYGCDKMLYLYSAKGCPNNCSFCYNKDFHRCKYRKRPLKYVLDEITYLSKNYSMNGVYFADELWCSNTDEMHEICDAIKSLNLDLVWGCQTRIGQFGLDDFRYMYESGCRWIFFGVESGSKNILTKMNKHIPYDKIIPTFSDCKKAKITAIASFIVGYPDETVEDLTQTVNLIEKLDTTYVNLNYFALIPGSDIYKELVQKKLYHAYNDISQLIGSKPVDKIEYKFCEISDIDLKVIHSYYMWRSFWSPDLTSNSNSHSFAKKVIVDALKSVKSGNIADFIVSTCYSGTQFLSIMFYGNMFPKTLKKYNIKPKGD